MKKINIALLSVGRESPLIYGFREAFAEVGVNGKIMGYDMDPYSVGLKLSDEGILLPGYDDENFSEIFYDIISNKNIDLIIPTADHDLKWWKDNHKNYEEYRHKFISSDVKTLDLTLSKRKFLKKLSGHNIYSPKILSQEKLNLEMIKFPVFINSNFGSGSSLSHKVNSLDELNYFSKIIDDYVLTEYIEGEEYSLDCYFSMGCELISIVPRSRIYTFGGESFVTKTKKNNEMIEKTIEMTEKFTFRGPINVQAFLNNHNDLIFFEINARFGGASRLSWKAGANAPKFIIEEYIGKTPRPIIGDYVSDLYMLRYKDDLFLKSSELL